MNTYLIQLYYEAEYKAGAINNRFNAGDKTVTAKDVIKHDLILGDIFAQMSEEEMRHIMDMQRGAL